MADSSTRYYPAPDWQVPEDWWRTFFGPDYLIMYRGAFDPETTAKQVRCVVRALCLSPGDLVLDCCCGHGRHLHQLRAMGYTVIGVDISHTQLNMARERMCLVRADARRLPFPSCFRAVISLYTSFGYFSDADNEVHLAEMARVLLPGGRLLLDQQNPASIARETKPYRFVKDSAAKVEVRERFHNCPELRRVLGQKELICQGRRSVHHFALRQYEPDELAQLARAHGLTVLAFYGDYSLAPLNEDSPRLILIAEKERSA